MMKVLEKALSNTDIEVRLSVPMESLGWFGIPEGEFSLDFEAVDMAEGRTWAFRLKTRENDTHPKPVLTVGWLAYVRHKRLRFGDVVELHASSSSCGSCKFLTIRALRKFNLLGKNLWLDVEQFQL